MADVDVKKLIKLVHYADEMAGTLMELATHASVNGHDIIVTDEAISLVHQYYEFRGFIDVVKGTGETPVMPEMQADEPPEQDSSEVPISTEIFDSM